VYIVIIGAGEVGRYVAEILIEEKHDVCIVEQDAKIARELDERLDCQVINGTGVSRETLFRAGLKKADLLLAITQIDEVNLIAAMTAEQINTGCLTVARVRNPGYLAGTDAIKPKEYGLDLLVGPEQAVADQVIALLQYAGPGEIMPVAGGTLALLEMPVVANTAPVWATHAELSAEIPQRAVIAAILGKEGMRIPTDDSRFEIGERISALSATEDLKDFLGLMVADSNVVERVLIVGGSDIAFYVARQLRRLRMQATILEADAERAEQLAIKCPKAVVIQADGSEPGVLAEQMVEGYEAVVVLLDRDEKALLTGIVTKQLGAKKVIVRADKREYAPIAHNLGVDAVISPRRAVADAILRFVRRGRIASTIMIGDHQGELIDFHIGKKVKTSLTEVPAAKLKLPDRCVIGAIVRDDQVIASRDPESHIQPGDHVFVIATREAVPKLEGFFG
jgi:trk system potassium uptake protein TrkA